MEPDDTCKGFFGQSGIGYESHSNFLTDPAMNAFRLETAMLDFVKDLAVCGITMSSGYPGWSWVYPVYWHHWAKAIRERAVAGPGSTKEEDKDGKDRRNLASAQLEYAPGGDRHFTAKGAGFSKRDDVNSKEALKTTNAAQSKWQRGSLKRSLGNRYVSYRSFEPAGKKRDAWTVYKRTQADKPKAPSEDHKAWPPCLSKSQSKCVDTRFKHQVKFVSSATKGFQYEDVRLDDLPTITDELNKEIINKSPIANEQKLKDMEREAGKIEMNQKMHDSKITAGSSSNRFGGYSTMNTFSLSK
jgi:hypothetical protein